MTIIYSYKLRRTEEEGDIRQYYSGKEGSGMKTFFLGSGQGVVKLFNYPDRMGVYRQYPGRSELRINGGLSELLDTYIPFSTPDTNITVSGSRETYLNARWYP